MKALVWLKRPSPQTPAAPHTNSRCAAKGGPGGSSQRARALALPSYTHEGGLRFCFVLGLGGCEGAADARSWSSCARTWSSSYALPLRKTIRGQLFSPQSLEKCLQPIAESFRERQLSRQLPATESVRPAHP